MNLQAKLTLLYVLLAVILVSSISVVDLINNMQQQFEATLAQAKTFEVAAGKFVTKTLNSQRTTPLPKALADPALANDLSDLLRTNAILEIAVTDPTTHDILADSNPDQLGHKAEPYPDFEKLVKEGPWYEKWRVLGGSDIRFYQLETPLGDRPDRTLVSVLVIIAPSLIKRDINPIMYQNAKVAVLFLVGAIIVTFLFSALAVRPLGRLRRQLDLISRGEYEPEKPEGTKPATDELSVIASKVSMLGQRLRGAQYEVSDLRGNIDRLLQDLEDAVFIFNRERRLVFASGSVEKFLGKERSDLRDQSVSDVFPPATSLGLLIAQASQTGRPIRKRRVPLAAPGDAVSGLAVVLLSVDMLETLPGGAHAGSGMLVRLRDPEAQRKLGRELQTADRLAAISRVTSGVAHEVKNPLNAILLHVEVAKAKLVRGDTDVAPQMEIISREILRLDRVVKTFLDFTRPVELNLVTVPLQELVGEIVELARPQAEAARILVNVEQQVEGVEVRVDRDLLKQAVLNVVVNGMQAMPDGGELRFQAFATEETAEIRISDTGEGIPEELRAKIFRLYFTTRQEGSGIGLAMTFRIVQLHDGTIDFTSEPGKGTTFSIRLPIAV
ncbi:MAG: PAS domain-containing protein [Acidobacteriia bacterium]|nr:PAS domain-containing protein [Terriglobia bacterium]